MEIRTGIYVRLLHTLLHAINAIVTVFFSLKLVC